MNIAVLELDNYEADDIIGTFAVHAPQEADVIIVTGDRDELQLLSSRTSVYFTKRGISDLKFIHRKFSRKNMKALNRSSLST